MKEDLEQNYFNADNLTKILNQIKSTYQIESDSGKFTYKGIKIYFHEECDPFSEDYIQPLMSTMYYPEDVDDQLATDYTGKIAEKLNVKITVPETLERVVLNFFPEITHISDLVYIETLIHDIDKLFFKNHITKCITQFILILKNRDDLKYFHTTNFQKIVKNFEVSLEIEEFKQQVVFHDIEFMEFQQLSKKIVPWYHVLVAYLFHRIGIKKSI